MGNAPGSPIPEEEDPDFDDGVVHKFRYLDGGVVHTPQIFVQQLNAEDLRPATHYRIHEIRSAALRGLFSTMIEPSWRPFQGPKCSYNCLTQVRPSPTIRFTADFLALYNVKPGVGVAPEAHDAPPPVDEDDDDYLETGQVLRIFDDYDRPSDLTPPPPPIHLIELAYKKSAQDRCAAGA